ncbi:MAG: cbhB, partial [Phycisphaerales bacterium]|nr:cbhB [Phycisphaerales bacterium]
GDLNMDQRVSNLDFTNLSNHINTGQPTTWASGDMDYSGTTTNADYTLLSNNFGQNLLGPAFARTLLPVGLPITTVEGQGINNAQVATFTDALNTSSNPTNATDYTATVSWGDANFLPATVTADTNPNDPAGSYVVTASSPGPLSNPDALIVTMVQYSAASGLQGRPASLGEPIVTITPAVAGLVATPATVGQVNLSWVLNANNATAIEVDRADNGGAFVPLTTTAPGNATTFSDTTIAEGNSYNFQVRAVQPGGNSAFTGPTSVITQVVQGLGATAASTSEIDLAWTALPATPAGATAIQIARSTDGVNFQPETSVSPSATAFADTNLTEGVHYYYQLTAVYGSLSSPSVTADAYTLPLAPSGLTATLSSANGVNAVNLSWTNNSQNASGFDIVRTDSYGTAWDLGSVTAPTTTFADVSAAPGQAYSYTVTALTLGTSTSGPSNSATVTTPAAGADTLLVTHVTSSEIDYTWNDDVPDATGIVVYGSTDGQTYTLLTSTPLPPNTASYQATGLTGGSPYDLSVGVVGSPTQPNAWFVQTGQLLTAPGTPVLTAAANNNGSVTLNWTGGFDSLTQFQVYRTDSAGNTQFVGAFPSTTCTDTPNYTDTFQYTVQALDNDGNQSGVSNTVSVNAGSDVQPADSGFATVLFVNGSVAQTGTGTSASPFKTIQEAANSAVGKQTPVEVKIATGTYREMVTVKSSGVTFTSYNGPVTVSGLDQVPVTADSNCAITSITASGTDVTAQLSSGNTFAVGDTVNITGVNPSTYDGFFPITSVSGNTMHYRISSAVGSPALGSGPLAQSVTWHSGTLIPGGYSAVTGSHVLGPTATTATDQAFVDSAGNPILLPEARFPSTLAPAAPDEGNENAYDQSSGGVSLLRIPNQTPYSALIPTPPAIMTSATFFDPSLSAIQTAVGTSLNMQTVLLGATLHIAPGAPGLTSGFTTADIWETYQITGVTSTTVNGATVYGVTYSIPGGSVLQQSAQKPQLGDFYYLTNLNLTPDQALQMGAHSVGVSKIGKSGLPTPANTQRNVSDLIDGSDVLHLSFFGNPGTVEVKQRDVAFDLSGWSQVAVNQINLVAATIVTDKLSTGALINGINANFLSAYDRTGINVVVDHSGPLLNPTAGQNSQSVSTAFSNGYLQFDSGIQLLGQGDSLTNSTINSCSANGVTVGADGVTVQGCTITNADIMGTDNAGIITSGSARPIVSVTATVAGTVAPLSDPAKPSYEGLVSFTLTIPNNPAITPGVWIYVANLQLRTTNTRFLATYAGNGTYQVTNTAQLTGGNMLVVYHERVPNPDYYLLYQDNNFTRDQDASSAAGVVSVVVGQSAPVNITDNVIADCSRSDITYRGAMNTNIVHNDVSQAGLDALDLGGIYAWGEDIGSASANSAVVISYNTVHDIVTGPAIYADNGNSGVSIEHNTVYNAKFGVQISSGSINTVVDYNTLDSAGVSIHSGAPTYYDSTYKQWLDIVAGVHYNDFAQWNSLGTSPDPSSQPVTTRNSAGMLVPGTGDSLYGFNLAPNTPSIANGNNVAVAYTSTSAGNIPTSGPTTTLNAVTQPSGTAYFFEDLGTQLGTLFHATRIRITFGQRIAAQFSIAASNDGANWSNVISGISGSTLANATFDTTVNLINRYVIFFFQPAIPSNGVDIAHVDILGTSDLAAASAFPPTTDLSQAKTANSGALPVPALGDAATAFTPTGVFPNSFLYVDLGASVVIDFAPSVVTGNFSIYYSNVTTGWTLLTAAGVHARYILYALAAQPVAGSVFDVSVLGSI